MHLLMLFNFIWIIRHLENYITQIINNNFEKKKSITNLLQKDIIDHFQQHFSFIGGETGVPRENRRPATSHWQNHTMLYQVHLARVRFELTMLVVIGTDCICSYKSNYHTITAITAPSILYSIFYTFI
jgi:hypothetical protein